MRSIEEIRALSIMDHELDRLMKNGLVLPPSWDRDTNVYEVRALLSHIAEAQKKNEPVQQYQLFEEDDRRIPTRDGASISVSENLETLGINPSKGFVSACESSGANMALAVAYLWTTLKKNAALRITGIYASATSGASVETVPEKYRPFFVSMEQNTHVPVMDAEAIELIEELYKPDPQSPLAYPITIPDPSIMPRTYFQACGLDPTRDCALVIEQVWRDAGVLTKLDIYPGMPHVFWALGLPDLEQTKKHEAVTRDGFSWLLNT